MPRLRTWTELGFRSSADCLRPQPISGRSQLKPCLCRGCGLIAAVPAATEWTRTRAVRGHGKTATATCPLPARVHGCAAIVVVSDSYRLADLRIQRDCFADAETLAS